jgi:hypothetical protein
MAVAPYICNAQDLEKEFNWFAKFLAVRMHSYFNGETMNEKFLVSAPPKFSRKTSRYSEFIQKHNFNLSERIALLLALCPHIRPELLDVFFAQNENYNRGFTEFGGIRSGNHGGVLPTGETLAFLLSGKNLEERFATIALFDRDHFFSRYNILKLEPIVEGEPLLSGALRISQDVLDQLTLGILRKPDLSSHFPAQQITTGMEWNDLVLSANTLQQLEEIKTWIEHGETLMEKWKMRHKLRPGYRCLFYGPPGTGKSITASLLGKTTGHDVYRVDLSMVVSKYIGETEKNLSGIFRQAEHKNWILFFDEADALFGKRTGVNDAHDRHANQEVSYLLQRIENYNGIIILASNMKANLDEAFLRRFESVIHFPLPGEEERLQLWQKGFPEACVFEKNIGLEKLATKHVLSGGIIMNVVRYGSLMALKKGTNKILLEDLEEGIRKELRKEGKTV